MMRTEPIGRKALVLPALCLALLGTSCQSDPTAENDAGGSGDAMGEPSGPVIPVNLQIDAEEDDVEGLNRIVQELDRRGIRSTIYVTADYANRHATLIGGLATQGFEIALHGYYTGEQLASMTYEEQLDLLTRALDAVDGCIPCGTSRRVTGFRPQYFSQNEDTFRVLDELGLGYSAGFKAGQLYAEGHADDVTPYGVEGHDFTAVPFTTLTREGEDLYLCDIAIAVAHEMSGEQWSEILSEASARAIERDEPLVVLFHGWQTGVDEDYWQAFVDFLDEIEGRAVFVSTSALIDYYAN